jgi:hypothetical protein
LAAWLLANGTGAAGMRLGEMSLLMVLSLVQGTPAGSTDSWSTGLLVAQRGGIVSMIRRRWP